MNLQLTTILCSFFTIQVISCDKACVTSRDDGVCHRINELASKSQNVETSLRKQVRKPVYDDQGHLIPSMTASLAVGKRGPILLRDTNFIGQLARFNRERIPERVVHAKGVGAHGYFIVTHDISKYTRAALFSSIGKRTPIFTRFSTTHGQAGSPDTDHDLRGFATKFYTEEGNFDLVGANLRVFPIRDPMLFPSLTRSQKRNPRTNMIDKNSIWDFRSLRPETTNFVLHIHSDYGYPDGYRHMNGNGAHALHAVNASGHGVYIKFTMVTQQGIENLTRSQLQMLAGTSPDYFSKDLYDAIQQKDFPSWELNIQVMTYEQAAEYEWNPFDITKEWYTDLFPLMPVGRVTLNRIPDNFFAEVEMVAFDPSNLVSGLEMTTDRTFEGGSFSYFDAQRYRLGANFAQLAINRPRIKDTLYTYNRDGACVLGPKTNGYHEPNYYPNSYDGPEVDPEGMESVFKVPGGVVQRYDNGDDDNFSQAKIFWNKLEKHEKKRLVNNLAYGLNTVDMRILERNLANFKQVDPLLAKKVRVAVEKMNAESEKLKSVEI